MSDLRVGVIAEGPTDVMVIEALLQHLLQRPFVLTQLQPEGSLSFGATGAGWTGIYKWCRQIIQAGSLQNHPLLAPFQLLIFHIDADVASKTYTSGNITDAPNPTDLPCDCDCPPAQHCIDMLTQVLAGWLALAPSPFPHNWVFCIPSKSLEAWSIAAVYGNTSHVILHNLECYLGLEAWVKSLPKPESRQLAKTGRNYRDTLAPLIVKNWNQVKQHCRQADRFEQDLRSAI